MEGNDDNDDDLVDDYLYGNYSDDDYLNFI